MPWKKMAVFVIAFLALALVASDGAKADLIINGGFEATTGTTPKDYFNSSGVMPTGWSIGINPNPLSENITFVDAPGTADDGSYLSVYGPFPVTSPNGGNFIEADADPRHRSGPITQTVNGLIPGHTYAVSFYQAAGQQQTFLGPTFEEWQVGFNKTGAQTQTSPRFNLPGGNGGTTDAADIGAWQSVTLLFTADSNSDVLSFLANGTPSAGGLSLPPVIFLDGVSVNDVTPVPEPTSLLLMGLCLLGLVVAYLRQRRRLAVV
jgi:PEP-CTERM motif